jgi:hypothetical protein
MSASPRLRPFKFTEGQPVLLGGALPAVIRGRLRTFAGHALYQIELTGETAGRPNRAVMEDGLVPISKRSSKTSHRYAAVLSAGWSMLLLPPMAQSHLLPTQAAG